MQGFCGKLSAGRFAFMSSEVKGPMGFKELKEVLERAINDPSLSPSIIGLLMEATILAGEKGGYPMMNLAGVFTTTCRVHEFFSFLGQINVSPQVEQTEKIEQNPEEFNKIARKLLEGIEGINGI